MLPPLSVSDRSRKSRRSYSQNAKINCHPPVILQSLFIIHHETIPEYIMLCEKLRRIQRAVNPSQCPEGKANNFQTGFSDREEKENVIRKRRIGEGILGLGLIWTSKI
jgi:hypothetical protein